MLIALLIVGGLLAIELEILVSGIVTELRQIREDLHYVAESAREKERENKKWLMEERERRESGMTPGRLDALWEKAQQERAAQEQIEQQNREMVAKYKEVLATETLAEQVERHKREIAAMDARDATDAAAGLTNEHMNRIMRADILQAHSQQRLALEKRLSGRKGE